MDRVAELGSLGLMEHTILAVILVVVMFLGFSSSVHGQSKAAATPLEVKKTVDAFRGYWVLNGTDTEPGRQPPGQVNLTIDCKPTALGAAVSCSFVGRVTGVGCVEAASVIGYSPEEKVVRWMEISSTGEYHDHRGRWHGNVIEFDLLKFTTSGKRATEYLSISFPSAGQLRLRSVTETGAGKSILKCMGKRLKSE